MKLAKLSVAQLREQLDERDIDATGNKSALQKKLEEALREEGHDPSTFEFPSAEELILKKMEENARKTEEKFEENARKMEEKLEENARKMEEQFEENAKKVEENVRKMEEKLEENARKTEENVKKIEEKFDGKFEKVEEQVEFLKNKIKQLENMAVNPNLGEKEVKTVPNIEKEEWVYEGEGSGMKFKLPNFDGKSSWSTYVTQFEAIAMANRWTEQQKAISLTAALRGDAADILRSIPKDQRYCYKTLFARLENRYGDGHLQQVYKAQLRTRNQRANETLQEFEADIARMVRLAYPTAPDGFLEEIAIDTFVNGLRDSDLQKALKLARPKLLDEALAVALEHETASQTSRGHRVRTIGEETETESLEELVRRILRQDKIKRREPRCWNCGELGHLRRSCQKQPSEN